MNSSVRDLMDSATARLAQAGVVSARADAEVLLAHALGVERARLGVLSALGTQVEPGRFDDLLDQRADRVPLQHLTGRAGFRALDLAVGPGVFVPRPETEGVAQFAVEEAERLVAAGESADVVDLCTGSGAIALAVATEVPRARVHAVELDAMAHAWAQRNVEEFAPGLDLRLGDAVTAFDDLDGAVDVVVSNPPYVPPGSVPNDVEVARHDPAIALYGGGDDGLEIPRQVVASAARLLRAGGLVVVEHAEVQEAGARRMFTRELWTEVASYRDLTGRPRTTTARRR
ncbi:MAG: peptide chain release factor N(5)-glutamine methyltransferase [Janthinobacterium lividum]